MLIYIGRLLFIPGGFLLGFGMGDVDNLAMVVPGLYAMAVSFYIISTRDFKNETNSRHS